MNPEPQRRLALRESPPCRDSGFARAARPGM